MSTMAPAPPITDSDPPQTPVVTWRDAVTPLSRASRRRWTLCYALLLALLAASVIDDAVSIRRDGNEVFPLILIVALPVVFGMLRRGTRRIAALDHPDLDERDIAARNGAYRIAFPLLMLIVIAGLALLAMTALDVPRTTHLPPPDEHIVQTGHGWLVRPDALIGLGLWIALWAAFLPTGVLAWREPDALEPERGAGGLPESLRDALLGLALAGAIATALLADSDAGVAALVATLALLGALGRRASGQPVMSRERKWRVAIGVVMILGIVLYATFANV